MKERQTYAWAHDRRQLGAAMGLEVTEAVVLDVLAALSAEVSEREALLHPEIKEAATEVPGPIAGFVRWIAPSEAHSAGLPQ